MTLPRRASPQYSLPLAWATTSPGCGAKREARGLGGCMARVKVARLIAGQFP
jgi:hypothetical protein